MKNVKGKFRNNFYFLIIVFVFYFFIFIFLLPDLKIFAQELKKTEECKTRAECEALLNEYKAKISQYEKDIEKTQKEKKTLQNQIYILKKKIEKLNLQIEESNVMIKDVSLQIKDTESSIEETSFKIEDSKQKLANILREIYEEDQKTLLEILLSEKELSDFFDNLMYLETLNLKNKKLLENIKNLKSYLESQKTALDEERADLENLLRMQTLQRQEAQRAKNEQESFLKLTEAQYQKYLKEKEETEKIAQQIRARIFELIGVPKAPTFGEAYEIAKYVEALTGVRPAFLLAVLTQESNIGKNVGQCFLKNPKDGSGVVMKTGKEISRVMNPRRDVPHFLNITKELGRDPYNTPVSCPMEYGWGGAMGPAQFIPSTWVKYKPMVEQITGKLADPWDIKDAFLAAALYLKDAGASQQTYNAEWAAALIYFSGTTNKRYRFYGDSVMGIASKYEKDIKELEKVAKLTLASD